MVNTNTENCKKKRKYIMKIRNIVEIGTTIIKKKCTFEKMVISEKYTGSLVKHKVYAN